MKRQKNTFESTRAVAPIVAMVFALSGCGYSLAGRGSFLPEYIQTIGVPMFANFTPIFEVEQILTEKVRSEFIGRGRYKVVPDTVGIDALLRGEVSSISIEPAAFTGDQQASRYVFILRAKIALEDLKAKKVIWENPDLVFREEYEIASAATGALDANAFFGQETNAVERLAGDFAKTVVSAILEAF